MIIKLSKTIRLKFFHSYYDQCSVLKLLFRYESKFDFRINHKRRFHDELIQEAIKTRNKNRVDSTYEYIGI